MLKTIKWEEKGCKTIKENDEEEIQKDNRKVHMLANKGQD